MLNGRIIDLAPYRAQLAEGMTRQELTALFEELMALAGRVKARLELGATEQPTPAPANDDRMLTVDEAAVMLRRSRQWIYRHSKTLPFVRRLSAKSLLCSEAGINRWLASRKA